MKMGRTIIKVMLPPEKGKYKELAFRRSWLLFPGAASDPLPGLSLTKA
jgi:hypothetical protein